MSAIKDRKRIAVVGGGVSGITAAYLLQQVHEVTLFERNPYVGGHTRTWVLREGPDAGTPVDTGFIVFNNRTYPNFIRLLGRLKVAYQPSEMSFSCYTEASGLAYAGTGLSGLFARRLNAFSPSYCQAAFESRTLEDLQLVLTRPGNRSLPPAPYGSEGA